MRYLLDTDICSYVIRRSNPALLKKLAATPLSEIAISSVTEAELLYGVEISPRAQQDGAAVMGFLRHLEVLAFGGEGTRHYAQIRAHLKRSGEMIGANNLFIAAHARAAGLTLVTNNTEEFGRIPGLSLENWTDAPG